MTENETNYNHAYFARLAASRPGTAAEHLPLVMWEDRVMRDTPHTVNRHHDFLSLYVVRQGRGTHTIDGAAYGVARGDVYAMGQGMEHFFTDCDDLILDTFHFAPSLFDAETLAALRATGGFHSLFIAEPEHRAAETDTPGKWLHLTPDAYAPIDEAIGELRQEWQSGTPTGVLMTRCLFLRLIVMLARRYAESKDVAPRVRTQTAVPHEHTVAAAVGYMDAHFTDSLRIEQVAAFVYLSPDRFTEVFSLIMGRTPRDYVRHLRLERAKSLLNSTNDPVAEIAVQSGFSDAAYFNRVFRAAMGMTPTAYRRR